MINPDSPSNTVNIAILDKDRFFTCGLEQLLTGLFASRFQAQAVFHYAADNIAQIDVIIVAVNPGDHIDCLWPWLAQRKLRSLVVGFYEHHSPAHTKKPLFCLTKALWLHKRSNIVLTGNTLVHGWREMLASNLDTDTRDCGRCSRLKLTEQQRKIAFYMTRGMSINAIASALNINTKTVSVHKYFLMEKLHLQTNQQFMEFLHRKNSVMALSLD
ncbi:helix-turn-helix transcriptional regulator [Siccibacter colletis]|uniref:helix-turn-helix transcriptional regulator n=1 Tax=Siccibacter colletis TaxID=1505757 RepID=UPI003CF3791E